MYTNNVGHLRVTITIGHLWVTISPFRVTIGHLKDGEGNFRVTISHYRITKGHYFSFLSKNNSNTTELHPDVRHTC